MKFLGILSKIVYGNDKAESKLIYKNTINMAWPSMLESFLVALTSFLDTIMVSSLGIGAIASVGLVTQPRFIALALFFAMSTAISSIVARRRGENDRESANKVLKTSLLFGTIAVIIISVLFIYFSDLIISFCGSKPDTHKDAVDYFNIMMSGLILNVIGMLINAAQRGSGNTRISMITNLTSNAINVVFNFLLIGGNLGFPALGVRGAAIATNIGAGVACVLSIISITKSNGFLYIKAVKGVIARARDIKSMINIGLSAFVEQLFLRIGFLMFSITVASLGTIEFGANQIGMNFMSMTFSIGDGLSIASVALVGRSLGEKRPEMAKKYAITCQKIGFVCSLVISSIYMFWGRELFSLFERENMLVIDYGEMIMRVISIVLFAQIYQVTLIGSLRGAGDTKYTALISLLSVAVVRPLTSWLLCYPCGLGLLGIWLGLCADQATRLLMGLFRFNKGKWLEIKI